eukprot:CCRYP_012618-RA/>CCRYP_012618-RA protein AED:0.61 eAED:0.48 QI:0/0/0/1/0/0/2/0/110
MALTGRRSRNRTDKDLNSIYCNFVTSVQPPPGCSNPHDLTTTALIDTGANITLLQTGAPAKQSSNQTDAKSVTQPNGTLLTTETIPLFLNRLPASEEEHHGGDKIYLLDL